MKEKKITSFSDFIDNVRRIKNVNEDVIFRGVVNYNGNDDKLVPKLFRGENLKIKENELINGILSDLPNDFKNINSNLDILLKLQHYGIPTRLLDVSINPYVALFFSCDEEVRKLQGEKDKKTGEKIKQNGIVYIIDGKKMARKTVFSDTVAIISSISRLSDKHKKFLKEDLCKFLLIRNQILIYFLKNTLEEEFRKSFISQHKIKDEDAKDKLAEFFDSFLTLDNYDITDLFKKLEWNEDLKSIVKIIESPEIYRSFSNSRYSLTELVEEDKLLFSTLNSIFIDNINKDKTRTVYLFEDIRIRLNKAFNKTTMVKKLLHEVRNFKPGFRDELLLSDLYKDYLVTPHNTNDRVKNQQGGFILKGISDEGHIDSDYIMEKWEIPYDIIGFEDSKQLLTSNILGDLATMNIDNSFIYPDLEHYNVKKFMSFDK